MNTRGEPGCRALQILVADDERHVRESVVGELERIAAEIGLAVEVFEAPDGSGVLDFLEARPLDILFLDYRFQHGMSGTEVLGHILDPFEDIFVVLISGIDEGELSRVLDRQYQQSGRQIAFLRKPFDRVALRAKLHEANQYCKSRALPFPLAYVRELYESGSTEQSRYLALLNIGATVVKFSLALLFSDLIRLKLASSFPEKRPPGQHLMDGSALGLLNALLQHLRPHRSRLFVEELATALDDPAPHLGTLDAMVRHRNANHGHGVVRDEQTYAAFRNSLSESGLAAFEALRFLSDYHLVYLQDSDIAPDGSGDTILEMQHLCGTKSLFRMHHVPSRRNYPKRRVYLRRRRDDTLLSLYPFVVKASCADCQKEQVFLFDDLFNRSIHLRAVVCNHTIVLSQRDCPDTIATLFRPR